MKKKKNTKHNKSVFYAVWTHAKSAEARQVKKKKEKKKTHSDRLHPLQPKILLFLQRRSYTIYLLAIIKEIELYAFIIFCSSAFCPFCHLFFSFSLFLLSVSSLLST